MSNCCSRDVELVGVIEVQRTEEGLLNVGLLNVFVAGKVQCSFV